MVNKIILCAVLFICQPAIAAGVIQLTINDQVLANASVIDTFDGRNQTYTTDANGSINFRESCAQFNYESADKTNYISWPYCGINEEDRTYRLAVEKPVTLSGKVSVNQNCNCYLSVVNLETGLDTSYGTSLEWNLAANFNITLPAARYRIKVISSNYPKIAPHFYIASIGVDARNGSVSNISLAPNNDPEMSLYGKIAPRGDLISVEPTATKRLSVVKGKTGSVEPLVPVSLANLQTGQVVTGVSNSDGSFEIEFFAPPGASVHVSQDIHAHAYNRFSSSNPGTVIRVSQENESMAISTGQRLNRSAKNEFRESSIKGEKDPGVIWLSGSLDSNQWEPGRRGKLEGTVEIFSRNLGQGNIPQLTGGDARLELVFNSDGKQKAAGPENSSSDLTVTGLPIDRSEGDFKEMIFLGQIEISGYKVVDSSSATAKWSLDYEVPVDTPDGIYQLILTGRGWSMNPMVAFPESNKVYFEDVYGELSFHLSTIHGAARIEIGNPKSPKLYTALLLNQMSNGSRGTVSTEEAAEFGISGHIITNSNKLILPLSDAPEGVVRSYNLEPFIPLTAYSNKEWLSTPKIPFKFPSGSLSAKVIKPNGETIEIKPAPFRGSYVQRATTAIGEATNRNSNSPDMHYALTTYSKDFNYKFDEYGEHKIELSGNIEDIYGNTYNVSGQYSVYIAELFDIETGVYPGTPFEVGNYFSPSLITQPGLPASVEIELNHYPESSLENKINRKFNGEANRFGYFASKDSPFQFESPGEYHVNYDVSYWTPEGVLWMASRNWASVVATPNSPIIARGRKGNESDTEQRQWYLFEDTSYDQNAHYFSPFQTGDVVWTNNITSWNAALQNIVTLEDTNGDFEKMTHNRNLRVPGVSLISSSVLDKYQPIPPFVNPNQPDIHWGYYYSSIGRPGVSVREFVGTANSSNGYWRFDTPYNYQLGNGYAGDQPNDFKFMFGGAVYRAQNEYFNYYGAYASLWTMLPDSDAQGGRVMPPFQGAAGGPSGGPLFNLLGKEIDIFVHPQGVRPGSILQVGDRVIFSAQVAPTLPSRIQVEITAPSGKTYNIDENANKIGYFYNPENDFTINEPGVYSARVIVTHEGLTSAGNVEAPYPTGSVLGATSNTFEFYVVSDNVSPVKLTSVLPSKLPDDTKIDISFNTTSNRRVNKSYTTVVMPGFILSQGESAEQKFLYDASKLHSDFPNLDLPGGELEMRNGADTVTMSFLLESEDSNGNRLFEGRQVLIQGEDVLYPNHVKTLSGNFSINIENTTLSANSRLKSDIAVNAKGDGDIYVAVVLPDENFITITKQLHMSNIGEIIPFDTGVNLENLNNIPIVDILLDAGITSGKYKFIVVITSAGKSVEQQMYWLGYESADFIISN